VTFSDHESRTCTFATSAGVTICSWDSTLGLVNAVTSAAIAGGYDAEPSAILIDYCTDVNHGAGFGNLNISQITAHSWSNGGPTYYDSFKTYCTAYGLFISPWEDTQRAATDFIKDLLEIGNSNCVMSAGVMNIVPYGDVPITGNGVTYTPNLEPLFSFTDSDYMKNNQGNNDDPVVVIRKPLTETYNVVRVEFLDRGNSYNTALAEWTDPLDIAVNGIRVMANKSFHQICDARVAGQVAALIGQRQLYVRNTYQFTVRADYSILEPMDLVSITDSNLGINDLLVRITETQDDKDDVFTITAEDVLVGTASAPKYNFQFAQGYAANFATLPFLAAAPVVFSVPAPLVGAGGGYELAIAVGPGTTVYGGGTNGDWGGCDAYGSLDGVTYRYIGRVSGAARYGTIMSAITATALSVNLELTAGAIELGLQMENATTADFAANRALLYLDGEIVGFEYVTSIGSGQYEVAISRGLFGTTAVAHAAGASWARLDQSILYFTFDPGMVGSTLYMEFTAFNSVGRNEQPQSESTVFTHLIEVQNGSQLLGGPLTLQGTGVGIVGNSVFKTTNTAAWDSGAWSLQGYSGGAFVTFTATDTVSDVMMGLNAANGYQAYTTLAYAIYCNTSGELYCWESGVQHDLGSTFQAGDVLSIIYNGVNVVYTQNGNQLRKVNAPAGLTLYLNSDFYTYQAKLSAITFGPYGASTPVLWATRGLALASDSYAFKGGGSATWNSDDAYSIQSYSTCNIVFKANNIASQLLVGFVVAVPASPGYTTMYGFDLNSNAIDGQWTIYELGASTGVTGVYGTATRFSITYDGTNLVYAVDGNTVRTKALSASALFAYLDFYSVGAGVNSLDFGPGTTVPLIDSTGIGAQAATEIISLAVQGPVNVPNGAPYSGVFAGNSTAVTFVPGCEIAVPAQTQPCLATLIVSFTAECATAPSSSVDPYQAYTTGGCDQAGNVQGGETYTYFGVFSENPTQFTVTRTFSLLENVACNIGLLAAFVASVGVEVTFSNVNSRVEIIKK
jgi:hypothetical protein